MDPGNDEGQRRGHGAEVKPKKRPDKYEYRVRLTEAEQGRLDALTLAIKKKPLLIGRCFSKTDAIRYAIEFSAQAEAGNG